MFLFFSPIFIMHVLDEVVVNMPKAFTRLIDVTFANFEVSSAYFT